MSWCKSGETGFIAAHYGHRECRSEVVKLPRVAVLAERPPTAGGTGLHFPQTVSVTKTQGRVWPASHPFFDSKLTLLTLPSAPYAINPDGIAQSPLHVRRHAMRRSPMAL